MQKQNGIHTFVSGGYLLAASALVFLMVQPRPLRSQEPLVTAQSGSMAAMIPQQVRFTGTLANRVGETVEAQFRIYGAAEGGEAIWKETQKISVGEDGSYAVLLGATRADGLTQKVFGDGQARWLGVSVNGGEELPRELLASAPYAMKAADAETLGGLPAQSFVTQAQLAATAKDLAVKASPLITPFVAPSGSGSTDYIPMWINSTTLGNSVMEQLSGNILVGSYVTPAGLSVAGSISNYAVGGYPSVSSTAYNNVNYEGPHMVFTRYEGTNTAPLPVTQNDTVGWFDYFGWDGSAVQRAAEFTVFVDGPVSSEVMPGRFQIATTNAAGASTARFVAYANDNIVMATHGGKVGVGTGSPGATLEVNGTAKFDGNITFASSQVFPIKGTGGGTITGITTSSPLTGSGTAGSVALGLNETMLTSDITPSLETSFDSLYAQLGAANTFTTGQIIEGSTSISGVSISGPMLTVTNDGDAYSSAIAASNNGNYGTGIAVSGGTGGFGLLSEGDQSAGAAGVLGYLNGGSGFSNSFYLLESDDGLDAGLWGDAPNGESSAVIATADNAYGGVFFNDSSTYSTILVLNNDSGGTTGLVRPRISSVIRAGGPGGICGISETGNIACTGQVKTLVSTEGGARQVETYAVQSAENWVEDYGSGQLSHGSATMQVEPGFAATVNTGVEFHVFLTPGGDCKGLYVTNKTKGRFEVHELGGGTSDIPFDYKIVAKRNGMEGQRLVDVTEQMRVETDAATSKKLAQPLPRRVMPRVSMPAAATKVDVKK